MTDKEILDEVYRRLKGDDPHGWKTNPLKDGVTSFIEREREKQGDEKKTFKMPDGYNVDQGGPNLSQEALSVQFNADILADELSEVDFESLEGK
jgi:hypothetical protein